MFLRLILSFIYSFCHQHYLSRQNRTIEDMNSMRKWWKCELMNITAALICDAGGWRRWSELTCVVQKLLVGFPLSVLCANPLETL